MLIAPPYVAGFGPKLANGTQVPVGSIIAQPATMSYSSFTPPAPPLRRVVPAMPVMPATPISTMVEMSKELPVTTKDFAVDTTCSVVNYFQIKEKEGFLESVQQVIKQVKLESKCLQYGFTVCGDKAFCRSSYSDAEGILVHFQNIDLLLKNGLCNYGDLLWLQLHGPPEELAKLNAEPMIQEMNVEFYELVPNSFKVEFKKEARAAEPMRAAGLSMGSQQPVNGEPVQATLVEPLQKQVTPVSTPIQRIRSFQGSSVVATTPSGPIVRSTPSSFVPPVKAVVRTNSYVPPAKSSYTPPPLLAPTYTAYPGVALPMATSSFSPV